MSLQKISQMLKQGSIINVSLMSDTLNSFLSDLCQILINQSSEIEDIRNHTNQSISKSEFERFKASESKRFEGFASSLEILNGNMLNELNQIKKAMQTMQTGNQQVLENLQSRFLEKQKQLEQTVTGDIIILQQQAKTSQAKINEHEKKMANMLTSVSQIKSIDDSPVNMLDNIKQSISELKTKLEKNEKNNEEIKEANSQELQEMKKTIKTLKNEYVEDIKILSLDVKEIREQFNDLPEFASIDGKVDTETLVRAIQRNSRRIDNFNESLSIMQKAHCKIHDHYDTLTGGFTKVQENLISFANHYNSDMSHWSEVTNDHQLQISMLLSIVDDITNDIHQFVEVESNGLNVTANTIQQLQLFLTKITTRPLPTFMSYDDVVFEFQRISDLIGNQNDDILQKKVRLKNSKPKSTLLESVNIPLLEIKVPELENKLVQYVVKPSEKTEIMKKPVYDISKNFLYNNNVNNNSNTKDNGDVAFDNSRLFKIEENLTKFITFCEEKFDQKADVEFTEKMVERLRTNISKCKGEINQIRQQYTKCVKVDEINSMTASAGDHHIKIGQLPKSMLSSLPRLTDKPHDIVYGKKK